MTQKQVKIITVLPIFWLVFVLGLLIHDIIFGFTFGKLVALILVAILNLFALVAQIKYIKG